MSCTCQEFVFLGRNSLSFLTIKGYLRDHQASLAPVSYSIGIHRKVRERGHHRPSHSICTSLSNHTDPPTLWIWLWLANTTGLYIWGVWLHHALFFCGCDSSSLISFKNSYNFDPLVRPFLVFPDYYQLINIVSIYIGTDMYAHFFCPLMESGTWQRQW